MQRNPKYPLHYAIAPLQLLLLPGPKATAPLKLPRFTGSPSTLTIRQSGCNEEISGDSATIASNVMVDFAAASLATFARPSACLLTATADFDYLGGVHSEQLADLSDRMKRANRQNSAECALTDRIDGKPYDPIGCQLGAIYWQKAVFAQADCSRQQPGTSLSKSANS